MMNDYIYIKLCSNKSMCLSNLKIKLIDKYNNVIFDGITDDFGKITEHEKEGMRKQLPDYFERKLGNELIAFVARSNEKIISAAYLQIIEMPANVMLLNGLYGEVLSVYTEPEYRGKGICTQLIKNLLEYGKKAGLGRVDLSATKEGYPVYKKVGFTDKKSRYTSMTYKYE